MQIISKAQLKQSMDKKEDLLLVDVLPKENFDDRHIPGAINIPFKDNADFTDQVAQHAASKDKRIVVYCKNTECPLSKEAAKKLEEEGYTNVQAFEEGVEGWFGKATEQAA